MPTPAGAPGHVIIAPDKFKGTLTAAQVAQHVAVGLRRVCPGIRIVTLPVADGGDGTVDSVLASDDAGFRRRAAVVRGPTGQRVDACFATRGTTAIVEAAEACGLRRLPGARPAPLTATSYGAGELVRAALHNGAGTIVLGLGGVACTDGGAGLVQALGVRLLDRAGAELPPGGAALAALHRIGSALDLRRLVPGEVVVACDVDNPLLGRNGAAHVYAPQKGATADDVAVLEKALARWADVAEQTVGGRYRDQPGAGAAGGLGFAALAFLGATMRPGIGLLLEHLGFARHLAGARLVVTGEGSLDAQTLRGKAPAGVARAAAAARIPVVAVAGTVALGREDLGRAGISAAYPLGAIEPDPRRCMTDAGPLLEDLAQLVAREWLPTGAREEGTR